MYTTIGSMVDEITSDSCASGDTLSLAGLKVPSRNPFSTLFKANIVQILIEFTILPFFFFMLQLTLAYTEALMNRRFTIPTDSIIQSTFLGSVRKRVEEIFNHLSTNLKSDVREYMRSGTWPRKDSGGWKDSKLLSWYLQWYNVPPTQNLRQATEKLKAMNVLFSSSVPLLHLLFPRTHATAIAQITEHLFSS